MKSTPFLIYIFPVVGACTWKGALLGLLIRWGVTGKAHLLPMREGQNIPYISDLGGWIGQNTVFIAACTITALSVEAAILEERRRRWVDAFKKTFTRAQKIWFVISILTSLLATLGLIVLSIFDNVTYLGVHGTALVIFVGGYGITALITVGEYRHLARRHPENRIFCLSAWSKLCVYILQALSGVGLTVSVSNDFVDVGAVFEWLIGSAFAMYILTLLIDLHPSARTIVGRDSEAEVNT